MRKSKHGWWPHFLHADSIDGILVSEYAPIEPKRLLVPPPIFKGEVRYKLED